MKLIITCLLLLLGCSFGACSTSKILAKNCTNVAQNVYECEELK